MFKLVTAFLLAFASTSLATPHWPRPTNLLAYFPLDASNKLADLGPNNFRAQLCQAPAKINSDFGPFGEANTSVILDGSPGCILRVADDKIDLRTTSFTVSFYFKPSKTNQGSVTQIFNIGNDWDMLRRDPFGLRLSYTSPDTIRITGSFARPNGVVDEKYCIYSNALDQKDDWNFVSIVFDRSVGNMSLFGKYGQQYSASKFEFVANSTLLYANGNFSLGNQGNKGDSFACLSIYNVALTDEEIALLRESCAILQSNAPQCGQSRRAGVPTIPKQADSLPGQFPWIVSIRNNAKHVCSGTLISRRYVLTTASCLKNFKPNDWRIVVGEFDLTNNYEDAEIWVSGTYYPSDYMKKNVAILELGQPVDISNRYVGQLCPVRRLQTFNPPPYYFAGWGAKNLTKLQHFEGNILDSAVCRQQYPANQSYDPNAHLCFLSTTNRALPCGPGDEGGALLAKVDDKLNPEGPDRFVLIGVFDQHANGCSASLPSLFVDAKKPDFIKWINDKLACGSNGNSDCPKKSPSCN